MRLLFAGTPDTAVPSLRALLASSHEVAAVLTRPPARAGRGRRLVDSPVAEVAQEAGVPVWTPASSKDPALVEQVARLAPDACPVVAYGGLIPPALLSLPRHGWVNLHFSLLPAWRGAAPVQRAVMAGDEITGVTTFVLDEGLDTGPVLATMTESIRADDTSGTLLQRLADAGAGLLVASLDALESGSAVPVPQPGDGVSIAPKLTVAEAKVDWSRPRHLIDRQIRGCTPAPGAWTLFRGSRVKLAPVEAVAQPGDGVSNAGLAPGSVRVVGNQVVVGTGQRGVPVALTQVQPPGKRMMPATDWARGARFTDQESFDG